MRAGWRVFGCLAWLLAAACGAPSADTSDMAAPDRAAPQTPAAAAPTSQASATGFAAPAVRASIHPDLPEHTFRLVGEPIDGAEGTFAATGLEIHRDGEAGAAQVIEGLAAEVPLAGAAEPVEVLDMNFDGYGDIRIVEFLPAGPNVPYLNWLFDPASGRFVSSPELDELSSPTFDAAGRRVLSEWRDGAASYGTDVYEMVDGRPVAVRRERREYTEDGVYERTVLEPRDGDWQVVEREIVRE